MSEQNKIQLFENQPIRTAWNEEQEEWYFSVVDVIHVLTGSENPRRYWSDLKRKLKSEGATQLYENIVQLKMKSSDGKNYKTDAATTEQLLRIIQSIPSPRAEPVKRWLAEVGRERIEETIDPEQAIDRALETYLKKGYDPDWVHQRLLSIPNACSLCPNKISINPNDTQTLHFYNDPVGGVEIIKVNADKTSQRIPNTTFEIRKVDDALVDTVTTGKNGSVFCSLPDGAYYAVEVEAADGFRLDNTPHYFEVKGGKTTTLTVKNEALSGILIHKIDSTTGEGIYGVTFLLYDGNKNPMGQYESDQDGYVYITDLEKSGRYYIRELENEGYHVDKQLKTVYVTAGKTIEIEWENEPVTGQIQIYKYAAEYNEVTGTAPGTPLKGAVYEIVNARSGKVLDYITTDARGVAASKPLPLTRYQIREVTAPAYWQVSSEVFDVTLEYPGQIIKLSAYDKPSSLGVTITKRGNSAVMAGSQMRYDFTVANTSNVPLESFFWHDRIPTDIANATVLSTGTYSARLTYRILYKTNYSANYQVLASNLLSSNNYSFALNAIPMQAGEVVTDIYFDFGTVPVGFQSVANPTLSVMVKGMAVNGYQMVNRADAGGKYQGTWQTATANWITIVRKIGTTPKLPKTGY